MNRTTVFVDKLTLTFNIEKFCYSGRESVNAITSTLRDKVKDSELRYAGGEDRIRGYKYTFILLLNRREKSVCRISVDAYSKDVSDFRIEWNPYHDTDNKVWEFLKHLFFDEYEIFFEHVFVTRSDMAYDVFPVTMDSILVTSTYSKISRDYTDKGRLETIYIGSRESRHFFRIYNKSKERKKRGLRSRSNVIRVEAEMKPRCLLKNLQSIANPFVRLTIGRSFDPRYLGKDEDLKALVICYAQKNGLQAALQRVPKEKRKEIRNWFRDYYSVQWHDYPEFDAEAKEAINRLLNAASLIQN